MITSSCKTCGKPCVLQDWGGRSWVHEDEELTFKTGPFSISNNYDHEAIPNLLDADVIDIQPDKIKELPCPEN